MDKERQDKESTAQDVWDGLTILLINFSNFRMYSIFFRS